MNKILVSIKTSPLLLPSLSAGFALASYAVGQMQEKVRIEKAVAEQLAELTK